ncbi:MAG: helix-turn-helix transcriptional regulator [Gammaproteobacteria bacterium]
MTSAHRQLAHGIRFLRKQEGLTQEALAERLGIDVRQYRRFEGGYSRLSLDHVVQLSRIFGVSVDDLLQINHQDPFDTYLLVYSIRSLKSPIARHLVHDVIKVVRSYDENRSVPQKTGTF